MFWSHKKNVDDAIKEYEDDETVKELSIKCESSIMKTSVVFAFLALLL